VQPIQSFFQPDVLSHYFLTRECGLFASLWSKNIVRAEKATIGIQAGLSGSTMLQGQIPGCALGDQEIKDKEKTLALRLRRICYIQ
jgi:hypothetical protein